MRVVVQRVREAQVRVDGRVVGQIGPGLCVLVGVRVGDTAADGQYLADKLVNLRIFPNQAGRFDRSVLDVGGQALIISQFTLYGDTRHGRRPDFGQAAPPELARSLYESFVAAVRDRGVPVQTGEFGAHMQVLLVNDGPVTLVVDSPGTAV